MKFSFFNSRFAFFPDLRSLPLLSLLLLTRPAIAADPLPSLTTALASKTDLWGEDSMLQPNGASYEFFENLLPPPRYVNADFHYYPIVLSAPSSNVKGRLISNGSGVNLPGGSRSWNDAGTAITFRVGSDELRFGDIRNRLQPPTLAEGYLPIVAIQYAHASEIYELEAFAATESTLANFGVIFVKFRLVLGTNAIITLQPERKQLRFAHNQVVDESGQILACLDAAWKWERGSAHAKIDSSEFATAAIVTNPLRGDPSKHSSLVAFQPGDQSLDYQMHRQKCVQDWQALLTRSLNVETPEPLVNRAWKNLIIQDFSLINGDRMNYSAGNQYEKMYAAESSDAAIPLMWWGYQEDMRRLLPVILDITDKRLPHHFAAHKLNAMCRFYWQTRDKQFVSSMRPRWQKELELILTDRTPEHGLLAKENYCTDVEVPVYSFPANATSWAALRDIAPVLEELGDIALAAQVKVAASELKTSLLMAVEKNQRNETQPPFLPMALFHTEETHDPITHSRLGSYWDLVANYVIGSRLFVGSDRELWLPNYMEQHGGLFMGLTRSAATNHSFWTGTHRTNPLYGMRYVLDTLRRDDPERALVSFYGMLAQGMTRNTFIGAEGCSIEPLDDGGRYFYCPPNSSSNGEWLAALRYLLIQDWDLDEDGRPDTLRLLFGTPRRWLEDGKSITVEGAPSDFGPVSLKMVSNLSQGEVIADLGLPDRNKPAKTLLRARVPVGWKVVSAQSGSQAFKTDDRGTIDITSLQGKNQVTFKVERE